MRLISACTLLLILLSNEILAQDTKWKYGLVLGINYNSYMLVSDNGFIYQGRPGFIAGAEIAYKANEQIRIFGGTEFLTRNFSNRIDRSKYRVIDSDDPVITRAGNPIYNYHFKYIEIPLGIKYGIKNSFFLSFSMSNAFKLSSDLHIEDKRFSTEGLRDPYKAHVVNTALGFGYTLFSNNGVSIALEPSFKFFLTDIDTSVSEDPLNFELSLLFLKR